MRLAGLPGAGPGQPSLELQAAAPFCNLGALLCSVWVQSERSEEGPGRGRGLESRPPARPWQRKGARIQAPSEAPYPGAAVACRSSPSSPLGRLGDASSLPGARGAGGRDIGGC